MGPGFSFPRTSLLPTAVKKFRIKTHAKSAMRTWGQRLCKQLRGLQYDGSKTAVATCCTSCTEAWLDWAMHNTHTHTHTHAHTHAHTHVLFGQLSRGVTGTRPSLLDSSGQPALELSDRLLRDQSLVFCLWAHLCLCMDSTCKHTEGGTVTPKPFWAPACLLFVTGLKH